MVRNRDEGELLHDLQEYERMHNSRTERIRENRRMMVKDDEKVHKSSG